MADRESLEHVESIVDELAKAEGLSLIHISVNYMRTTMGFNGLLITDDLSDASLNKVCTQDEAVSYTHLDVYKRQV